MYECRQQNQDTILLWRVSIIAFTSSSHSCRHQYGLVALLEIVERLLALPLQPVAMNAGGRFASAWQDSCLHILEGVKLMGDVRIFNAKGRGCSCNGSKTRILWVQPSEMRPIKSNDRVSNRRLLTYIFFQGFQPGNWQEPVTDITSKTTGNDKLKTKVSR